MAKNSKIVTTISIAIKNGMLKQPFNVNDVNLNCKNILTKSPSFLSKHRKANPCRYKVYFNQDSIGKYFLI